MTENTFNGIPCRHFREIDSTNTFIKQALKEGNPLPMPLCVYADLQTRGRGRMTRTFVSPGGGLYMSVLWPCETMQEAAEKTPYAAVAVCRALRDHGIENARIKWVNDVYVGDKKVCGILCEGVPDGVIIGIGVNIRTPEGGFPPEAGVAGALDVPAATRDSVLKGILQHLPSSLADHEGALQEYRSLSLLTGRQVVCQVGDRAVKGTVQGISDDFGLIIQGENGMETTLHAGEVTKVRPLKKAAFFDFDGTIRKGDSIVPYVSFVRKRRLMSLRQFARVLISTAGYLMGIVPSTSPKTAALSWRIGADDALRAQTDRAFAKWLIDTAYQDAVKEWQKLRAEGCTMVLLSASTENYMQYVAELLNADALLCTPVEEDETVRHNCHGKEKVTRAETYARFAQIDFDASCAYGDSGSDIFILTRVGKGHAVNPKKKLQKLAEKNSIPMLHWQ